MITDYTHKHVTTAHNYFKKGIIKISSSLLLTFMLFYSEKGNLTKDYINLGLGCCSALVFSIFVKESLVKLAVHSFKGIIIFYRLQ